MSPWVTSLLISLRSLTQQLFGLDVRALAAARAALALLILADLGQRSRSIFAHYDDWGTFPRAYLLSDFANYYNISLHMISGAWFIQLILFMIAAIFALMLLVGYKTRLATVASWVLLLSLHNRNPLVSQAGDEILRLGLFWGMFLPWGATLSVDAASKALPPPKKIVTSVATAAILIQVALIYFGAGIFKSSEVWLTQGQAAYVALNLDGFTTPLGAAFLNWPSLLTFISRGTYLLEVYGPFLLFAPLATYYFRLMVIAALALFHLGIITTLKIGLFPWIDIASLIFFLPPLFWDAITQHLRKISRYPLEIYYDSECSTCQKIVRLITTFLVPYNIKAAPAAENPRAAALMAAHNSWVVIDFRNIHHLGYDGVIAVAAASPFTRWLTPLLRQRWLTPYGQRLYQWVAYNRRLTCTPAVAAPPRRLSPRAGAVLVQAVAGLFLLYIIAWNVNAFPGVIWKLPARLYWVAALTRVDQNWGMFAPVPPYEDGWYVIPGRLRDGSEVNVFANRAHVSWEKPERVSSTYTDQFWRKYLMLIALEPYAKARPYYAQYLCQRWNKTHDGDQQLTRLSIYYVLERTPPTRHDPPPPLEHKLQLEYQCPT